MAQTIQVPEVKQKLLEQGGDTVGSTPEYLDGVVKTDLRKWAEVIKAAKIKVD
jgi:tripartite-type tricarboxylate transporter receptor subunit TctC